MRIYEVGESSRQAALRTAFAGQHASPAPASPAPLSPPVPAYPPRLRSIVCAPPGFSAAAPACHERLKSIVCAPPALSINSRSVRPPSRWTLAGAAPQPPRPSKGPAPSASLSRRPGSSFPEMAAGRFEASAACAARTILGRPELWSPRLSRGPLPRAETSGRLLKAVPGLLPSMPSSPPPCH